MKDLSTSIKPIMPKFIKRSNECVGSGSKRLSRFCHILSRNDVGIVYHSLSMYPIFFDAKLIPFVENLKLGQTLESLRSGVEEERIELFITLAESGMLVDTNEDELDVLKDIQSKYLDKPKISVLYLIITERCNFSCSYCAVENRFNGISKKEIMSPKKVRKAVDLFCKFLDSGADRPRIILYGGEPLLNFVSVEETLNYVEKCVKVGRLPQETEIQIITNGSLLDVKKANWLSEKKVIVSISLDGREERHNGNRRYANGRGTFRNAIKGYKNLLKAGARPSISCTVSEQNVNWLVSDVEWFLKELEPSGIGFNLRTDSPGQPLTTKDFILKATNQLVECYKILREKGVPEDRISRKAQALASGEIWLKDCAGCGNQLVILPNGKIGVCHAYTATRTHFSGNLDDPDFDPTYDSTFLEWNKRSPLNFPACYSCIALGNCGGGCPACAELVWGSIWSVDRRFCFYSKTALEWLIWDIYSQRTKVEVF